MFAWIAQNAATLIISAILVLMMALVIRKIIKDRKKGGCGCGCEGCGNKDVCHRT